ncbi:MAG: ATP-binding cassette domain-containing protein [Chloroflexota bacterium]|nr:ATP-binding cassette domain-containing protein [Chloroflexota bacterium]
MGTPRPAIVVHNLTKTFDVPEREAGLRAALRGVFKRRTREVIAVSSVSFAIERGEIVGFLGPNGAGKTTTLKMLAGLLYPTSGEATVLGYIPWQRNAEFLRQMTLVMGQRNQLVWDIPVADSYELNRAIYRVPEHEYRETLGELSDLLDLGPLIIKPVRNLSLGERMRCEIAGALLHRPRILFLDEPTLGLDVTAQRRIRSFFREYADRYQATVLLTSHYMADVEALAKRIVVIHRGLILYDGALAGLIERFAPLKTITVDVSSPLLDPGRYGEVVSVEEGRVTIQVAKPDVAAVTNRLLADVSVTDLTISDPPIDEIIDRVFQHETIPDAEVEVPPAFART